MAALFQFGLQLVLPLLNLARGSLKCSCRCDDERERNLIVMIDLQLFSTYVFLSHACTLVSFLSESFLAEIPPRNVRRFYS